MDNMPTYIYIILLYIFNIPYKWWSRRNKEPMVNDELRISPTISIHSKKYNNNNLHTYILGIYINMRYM